MARVVGIDQISLGITKEKDKLVFQGLGVLISVSSRQKFLLNIDLRFSKSSLYYLSFDYNFARFPSCWGNKLLACFGRGFLLSYLWFASFSFSNWNLFWRLRQVILICSSFDEAVILWEYWPIWSCYIEHWSKNGLFYTFALLWKSF